MTPIKFTVVELREMTRVDTLKGISRGFHYDNLLLDVSLRVDVPLFEVDEWLNPVGLIR